MTDAELTDVSEAILEQRDDIREYLANEGVDVSEWGDDADTTSRVADRDAADSD